MAAYVSASPSRCAGAGRIGRARNLRRSLTPFVLAAAFAAAGCHSIPPLNTAPLDQAGMSYDAIKELEAAKITQDEIAQIAEVRQAGMSDDDCVQLLKLYHAKKAEFDAGDAVAGLLQVGMTEQDVMQLAQWNQLGLGVGELQAIKLAGLSEEIVMDVAQAHEEGKPVLSGASLGRMKNAEMRASTLLELVKHNVPDSQASAIIAAHKHGVSDTEILRHFAGSG
ncbi:MAG TPA: hypothetical protein VMB47_01415 [Candidatus Aquilonibacter sp.]|nr:hypothetical protein [Candidatus Aquilonibacter sp.]